ncbi:MAG: PLP-dependent aminotransferase family protein, partial [Vallitaleaceae bacterium]|nr:PLP-dependent aminotransferase family protein [Vallitaleaceae bacterium]
MELTPHLEKNDKVPVYMQLYQYIKYEIMKGRLKIEDPLPSIRNLAEHLRISKTTVENAYGQLLAEGYIYSKPQKGYFVSFSEDLIREGSSSKRPSIVFSEVEQPVKQYYQYDFKNEYVEAVNFDLNNWKKHLNTIINYHCDELYTYGDLQGEANLRNAILKYVYRTRGVNGQASNIVVGAGVQPLLQILSSILKKQGIRQIAMEDPGFNRAKNVFFHNEFQIHALEVTDKGID